MNGMMKNYAKIKHLALLLGLLLAPGLAFGQLGTDTWTISSDVSSNYSGWSNGDNQGSGFGNWVLATGGTAGHYIGGTGLSGSSFGIYSDGSGAFATAERSFSAGDMKAGETFSVNLGHTATINGEIGLVLLDGGTTVFTLKFIGGQSDWKLNDGGSDFGSGQNYAANTSLTFTFTYEGNNQYSYTFGSGSGNSFTATSTISGIDAVRFYSSNQGGSQNFGFDNLSITTKYSIPTGQTTSASSDITIPYLEIASGATVNVNASTELTISGALTNAGTLNLLSDASGNYAQVLANSSSGSGTFTVQRTFTGAARWFYFGSPLSGGTVADLSVSSGTINTGTAANVNLYYYDPATANNGEGTWTKVPNTSFSTVNNGFTIYLGDGSTFGTLPVTLTASGNGFNDGSINIALDNSNSGWNLVTNPYPSAIDWDAYHDANGTDLTSTYYVYNGSQWIGYDAGANSALNSGTTLIAPMQAFFVQNTGSGSINLALDNGDRSVASNPAQNKSAGTVQVLKLGVAASDGTSDETLLAFDTQYTDGIDAGADAEKRMNASAYPNLYTTSANGDEFFVNKLNSSFTNKSVPMSFTCDTDQSYTISINDLRIPASWTVELEDLVTGSRVDLVAGDYQFSHVSTNSPERFIVHLYQSGVGQEEFESNNNYAYRSADAFNIELVNEMPNVEVQIISQAGQLVWQGDYDSTQRESINTDAFARGIYIVKVFSNGSPVLNQKLIK